MIKSRWRALLVAACLLILGGGIAFALLTRAPAPAAPATANEKPALLLLTSLPLMFAEDFSLEGGGSPALRALQTRYRVVPISLTDPAELSGAGLLLMAHPPAQPAEDLVALDRWVRDGGRVLLLADPVLEWPSDRPLGDRLRAPAVFMDTGLLAHWGLRLDAPDQRGPKLRSRGGYEVLTVSPGALFGQCDVSEDRLVAHCSIGKGRATIVADADVLDIENLDGPTSHNLESVLAELAKLESS